MSFTGCEELNISYKDVGLFFVCFTLLLVLRGILQCGWLSFCRSVLVSFLAPNSPPNQPQNHPNNGRCGAAPPPEGEGSFWTTEKLEAQVRQALQHEGRGLAKDVLRPLIQEALQAQ